MLRYTATRFLLWIPSVLLVMLGVYALAFYGAGDPIKLIFLRAPGDVAYDPVRIEAIRESAGLTKPFLEQFLNYVLNLLQGNFGNSLSSGRKVWSMISAAAPVSFQLGLCAIVVTALIAIPLGLIAGLNQNSKLDYTILGSALFLWAIPPYVAGPLLMVGFLLILPGINMPYGWGGIFDAKIMLPLIVLSFQPIALIVRQTRAAVIEVLSEDFVRTARAKGLSSARVVLKHGLRNALMPVITVAGMQFGSLLSGAVVTEKIFGRPGLGTLLLEGIMQRDYRVVQGCTLVVAVLYVGVNLLTDLLYAATDPRIRL